MKADGFDLKQPLFHLFTDYRLLDRQ